MRMSSVGSLQYIRDQGQNNELFLRPIVGEKLDAHSRILVLIP